jgi:hypothetical protein
MKKRMFTFVTLIAVLVLIASCAPIELPEQEVEGNIVKNGTFSGGAIKYIDEEPQTGDWYWFQNGDFVTSGYPKITNGYAVFDLKKAGDSWEVQFNQNIQLQERKIYSVSFKVKSDKPTTIKVSIAQTHDPYTVYDSKEIQVTTQWKEEKFDYTHPLGADEVVKLSFELGSVGANKVYFDSVVVLLKGDAEPIYGDNIIQNGDFSSDTIKWIDGHSKYEWYWFENGDYVSESPKVLDGVAVIDLKAAGNGTWEVQFNQDVDLEQGKKYFVSFKIKAATNTTVPVKIVMTQDPWTTYYSKDVSTTTDWQTVEFEYLHPTDAAQTVKFSFELGTVGPNTIYIDDVVLKEIQG